MSASISNQFKVTTLFAGAMMVTISLAWDNAITSLINQYIPEKYSDSKNAWFKLFYAVIVTLLALKLAEYFSS